MRSPPKSPFLWAEPAAELRGEGGRGLPDSGRICRRGERSCEGEGGPGGVQDRQDHTLRHPGKGHRCRARTTPAGGRRTGWNGMEVGGPVAAMGHEGSAWSGAQGVRRVWGEETDHIRGAEDLARWKRWGPGKVGGVALTFGRGEGCPLVIIGRRGFWEWVKGRLGAWSFLRGLCHLKISLR